jgi:5-methylcytosine-specific restriction endonuclease McrA
MTAALDAGGLYHFRKNKGDRMSDEYTINEQEELEGHGPAAENEEGDVFENSSRKKIIWHPMDYSIGQLRMMKNEKELDPNPAWQRNYVYDRTKASRLIESVLLDVPIPAVYLAEEKDNTLSVIDGQQRLTTFFLFIDEKFPDKEKVEIPFTLMGLKVLPEYNRMTFSELPKELKTKLKNTPIHVIIIKNDSDEDVKFDIFERLNTGSMKLNEDEIRNSVYRGSYIELLDDLADDITFDKLVRKANFKNRMVYRGMILRFFALSEKNIELYRPSMKQYCNKELRDKRNLSKEKTDEYRKRFRHSVGLCYSVFGENAFRRFNLGKEGAENGSWVASRINLALFDIQMCGFAIFDQSQLQGHYDEIRERMLDLMCNDPEFSSAIELKTSGREQMNIRFSKWLGALKSIVSSSTSRNFSYEIKKQLFDKDPTCGICHNQILAIEDAEVDHIDPYSRGGPTAIENAQIAHRYCNRHKSDKTV